ncbi:MAG: hypothetical protein IPN92_20985 [Chromatiaceae bacterium]|nr:hypothetical protein [Chromatiaceae bacterium]
MYRGKVTKVDAKGVYVQTADFGVIGPCQAVVANYAAGDMVLLSDVGSDAMPDLVVVGRLTGKGSAVPGASTDNTVARFDGTGGAQNAGAPDSPRVERSTRMAHHGGGPVQTCHGPRDDRQRRLHRGH